MCKHCHTLPSLLSLLQGNKQRAHALESVRLAMREIRATHNYTVIARPSRAKSTIADSFRNFTAAMWRYVGHLDSATFAAAENALSAYFGASIRANDKRPSQLLNPAGKPEPKSSPRHFRVAPDCFIYDHAPNDPGIIVASVDHARKSISSKLKSARHFSRIAGKRNLSNSAKQLAGVLRDEMIQTANDIEEQLHEYVSIHR